MTSWYFKVARVIHWILILHIWSTNPYISWHDNRELLTWQRVLLTWQTDRPTDMICTAGFNTFCCKNVPRLWYWHVNVLRQVETIFIVYDCCKALWVCTLMLITTILPFYKQIIMHYIEFIMHCWYGLHRKCYQKSIKCLVTLTVILFIPSGTFVGMSSVLIYWQAMWAYRFWTAGYLNAYI